MARSRTVMWVWLALASVMPAIAAQEAASAHGVSKRSTTANGARQALLVQVLLDRAGFSVGEIDGAAGGKTRKALLAFQEAKRLPASGVLDDATLEALGGERSPTTMYRITAEDVAGPFVEEIPKDLELQGALEALSYTSPLEALAERFHASPRLLQRLNPRAAFREGDSITVPDVEPAVWPAVSERRKAKTVETAAQTGAVVVSRTQSDVRVESVTGEVIFYAPVSSGSEHDPLPIGEWKVMDVYLMPRFNYNPELFWDADVSHAKTTIKPGPNNPVGTGWIDLDREHYGLHGTPEPAAVGVTQSHGCVRLTNWDIQRLVALVQPGTRVVFRE